MCVRSSPYAYAYGDVAGVLTCLCLCYAYACAYLYALVRTSLNMDYMISRIEPWYQRAVHVIYIHYSSPSPVCLPSRYLCYLLQFSSWITLKDSTATNSNFCGRLSTQWLFLSRPLDVCNYYANSPLEYFACVLLILLILFSFIQKQFVIWIKQSSCLSWMYRFAQREKKHSFPFVEAGHRCEI